jgi:hypothetical protein
MQGNIACAVSLLLNTPLHRDQERRLRRRTRLWHLTRRDRRPEPRHCARPGGRARSRPVGRPPLHTLMRCPRRRGFHRGPGSTSSQLFFDQRLQQGIRGRDHGVAMGP